eukprot:1122026-Amorphochlora_amoeboformis.AAC.1
MNCSRDFEILEARDTGFSAEITGTTWYYRVFTRLGSQRSLMDLQWSPEISGGSPVISDYYT